MKVAFIGGVNEGYHEVYDDEPLLHVELPIYDPNGIAFEVSNAIDSETYLLDYILAPTNNLIYYRHESLNETESLERLLKFFKRTDPAE